MFLQGSKKSSNVFPFAPPVTEYVRYENVVLLILRRPRIYFMKNNKYCKLEPEGYENLD